MVAYWCITASLASLAGGTTKGPPQLTVMPRRVDSEGDGLSSTLAPNCLGFKGQDQHFELCK